MAFVIVFMLGLLIIKTEDISYIVLLLVYGVDTVLTIIHRILLKEKITQPHRKHLYQLLANELKLPHLLVASIYALVQVIVSIGFFCVENSILYLIISAVILSMIYTVLKVKYFHLHKTK
jgi:hypothetical protein